MKPTLQAILAVALLFLIQQSTARAQSTTTYTASGAFAQTFFTANNSSVTLFVGRGCIVLPCSSGGTFIYWFAYNSDGSVTEGDGIIPDGAFQATTLQHMSLNVDTSQVHGFNTTTCTFSGGIFTCTNGPFGVMQADWQATEQSSSSNKQDTTTTMGPFTTKTHDDQSVTSGEATGAFLGTAFSDNGGATLGTNKSHTASITKPQ